MYGCDSERLNFKDVCGYSKYSLLYLLHIRSWWALVECKYIEYMGGAGVKEDIL